LKTAGPGAWAKPSHAGGRRYSIRGHAEKAEVFGGESPASGVGAIHVKRVCSRVEREAARV